MTRTRNYQSLGDDASNTQDNTTTYRSDISVYFQTHVNTTLAHTAGFRFAIPESIDPADITALAFDVTPVSAGQWAGLTTVEANANTPLANSSGNRPAERYVTAAAANGTTRWDRGTNTTSGTPVAAPSGVNTALLAALTATTPVDGYRRVAVYWKGDIGGPLLTQVAANEHPTYGGPKIAITTADNAVSPVTNVDFTGVSALGSGSGASARRLDIYRPAGTPPSGGWPVLMFVHGGRWVDGGRAIGSPSATTVYIVEPG